MIKSTTLYHKLKRASLHRFLREVSLPTPSEWLTFGQALDRRFKLLDGLLLGVKRGQLSEQELINRLSGLMIIRQTEDDLALYQEQLDGLTSQLQTGDIDESEFETRLATMAGAILLLMYFLGSQSGSEEQIASLRQTLESGGAVAADLDLSTLPNEAATQLQQAFDIAGTSASGLGEAILAGDYEESQGSLAARLALWLGTAGGIYALGQLFREDDPYLEWTWNPLKDHCEDCRRLNGQIHKSSEWRAFGLATGKMPQGPGLICGGWNCGCTFLETNGPAKGDF